MVANGTHRESTIFAWDFVTIRWQGWGLTHQTNAVTTLMVEYGGASKPSATNASDSGVWFDTHFKWRQEPRRFCIVSVFLFG